MRQPPPGSLHDGRNISPRHCVHHHETINHPPHPIPPPRTTTSLSLRPCKVRAARCANASPRTQRPFVERKRKTWQLHNNRAPQHNHSQSLTTRARQGARLDVEAWKGWRRQQWLPCQRQVQAPSFSSFSWSCWGNPGCSPGYSCCRWTTTLLRNGSMGAQGGGSVPGKANRGHQGSRAPN